uniref:Transmembrane protein 214-A n=1 Tax=Phallusia mammillata TaxID=59560 RepID=A0A6F9DV69_9ASCI|nr:transmembrane protein 214-A [Phallusia mammillata]
MSKTEKWETVGKPKNKPKNKPRDTEDISGLTQRFSSPLYDVSNTKSTQDGAKTAPKSPGRTQPKRKVKKPSTELPKYDYKTIEDGLSGEAICKLDEQISLWKEKYPDNPMNVCKDLVMYLDDKLRCPDESVTQSGREVDFPFCTATKNTQSRLLKLFAELNTEMVECIFQQYINSMLEHLARDMLIWGHKLCIQALAYSHPTICSQNLKIYVDKVQTMQNVPKRCLTLLWALGQSGVKDSRCGMKVWLEVMLPALHMKNMAPYCMLYIETILSKARDKGMFNSCVQPSQFMDIAEWAFDSQTKSANKSAVVKERIKEIYPTFRDIMTSNPNNKRQLFNMVITSPVEQGCQLRDELTSLAIGCLETDPHCFSLWRNMYASNLARTRLLLQRMHTNWDVTRKKMPPTVFVETLRAFNKMNNDAARGSEPLTSKPEFHDVRVLCEEMMERLTVSHNHTSSGNRLLWLTLGVAVLAVCGGLVAYDVTMHGGVWRQSKTYDLLDKNGVLAVTSYIAMRLEKSYNIAASFLQSNVPVYWKNLSDTLSPYLVVLGEKISAGYVYVWKVSLPFRNWSIEQFDKFADLLRTFGQMTLQGIDYVIVYATPVVVWIKQWTLHFWKSAAELISGEMTWAAAYDATIAHVTSSLQQAADWSKSAVKVLSDFVAPEKP